MTYVPPHSKLSVSGRRHPTWAGSSVTPPRTNYSIHKFTNRLSGVRAVRGGGGKEEGRRLVKKDMFCWSNWCSTGLKLCDVVLMCDLIIYLPRFTFVSTQCCLSYRSVNLLTSRHRVVCKPKASQTHTYTHRHTHTQRQRHEQPTLWADTGLARKVTWWLV